MAALHLLLLDHNQQHSLLETSHLLRMLRKQTCLKVRESQSTGDQQRFNNNGYQILG
jgi:hypothetical protein